MNTAISFPPPAPSLRLPRPSAEKWAATLTEERRRLSEDHQALREREANLREYEKRLRALLAEIEAGRGGTEAPATSRLSAAAYHRPESRTVFADGASLQAAWEKLYRARAILEAEQACLRDDRMENREWVAAVKQREEAVAAREAGLARREELLATFESGSSEPIAGEHTMTVITRLTRAPFQLARSVFGAKE